MAGKPAFSVIIPCYNEEANLQLFFPCLTSCFEEAMLSTECIFVDDGSTDGTTKSLTKLIEEYQSEHKQSHISFRVLEFSRNFGKEAAMLAGLEQAEGEILGFIDADGQQDPAVALKMLRLLESDPDCDCVAAVQEKRREGPLLRIFKFFFYKLFRKMSNLSIIEGASDFRVFRRQVADALLSLQEHFRFSKGMFSWIGFHTITITYQPKKRHCGKSAWSLGSLFAYAWNGITAFLTWPLQAVRHAGVILGLLSLILFTIDMINNLFLHDGLPMDRILLYVILLVSGIQMIILGVLGEYLARTYIEAKNRPCYILRSTYQFNEQNSTDITSKQNRTTSEPYTANNPYKSNPALLQRIINPIHRKTEASHSSSHFTSERDTCNISHEQHR